MQAECCGSAIIATKTDNNMDTETIEMVRKSLANV